MLIVDDRGEVVIDEEGAMLIKRPEERGAAWPAIEPEEKGIGGWGALRGKKK
jgi:hypothetical protein